MVINIPTNVKHWHGAKKDSLFSHIAIEVPGENTLNEWCNSVSDEEYNKLKNITSLLLIYWPNQTNSKYNKK